MGGKEVEVENRVVLAEGNTRSEFVFDLSASRVVVWHLMVLVQYYLGTCAKQLPHNQWPILPTCR